MRDGYGVLKRSVHPSEGFVRAVTSAVAEKGKSPRAPIMPLHSLSEVFRRSARAAAMGTEFLQCSRSSSCTQIVPF